MGQEKFVYQGKFIQVSEQTINGMVWEKAHFKSGVVVYPFTANGEIILVKEFRPHEKPQVRLKPITGIYEHDITPEENANKEMQEEVGYKAVHLKRILETNTSGSINGTQYFIVAWDLSAVKIPNPDGEESIQEVLTFPFEVIMEKIRNMEIPWNVLTMGLFRLEHLLKSKQLIIPGVSLR